MIKKPDLNKELVLLPIIESTLNIQCNSQPSPIVHWSPCSHSIPWTVPLSSPVHRVLLDHTSIQVYIHIHNKCLQLAPLTNCVGKAGQGEPEWKVKNLNFLKNNETQFYRYLRWKWITLNKKLFRGDVFLLICLKGQLNSLVSPCCGNCVLVIMIKRCNNTTNCKL